MKKDKVAALSSLFRYNKTINYYIRSQFQGMRTSRLVTLSAKSRGPHILELTSQGVINCIIYIRLKIKPNSVRIRFQSCQIFVLPSTGFEPTPLLHCSAIRLALHPAPQTTRLHPLPKKGASIVVVLPCLVRQIQGQT